MIAVETLERMVEEAEVGDGALAAANISDVTHENVYDISYTNEVPQRVQTKIRRRVESYLINSGRFSSEDIAKVRERHREVITPDRWDMMKDTPEHYWALVFAYGLGEPRERDFSELRSRFLSNPDKEERQKEFQQHYMRNQIVWLCVGIKLSRERQGVDCVSADEELEIAMQNSPIYRAFYTIWKGAMHQNISYESTWADNLIAGEMARVHRRSELESERIKAENERREQVKREAAIVHPEDVSMIISVQTQTDVIVPVQAGIVVPNSQQAA